MTILDAASNATWARGYVAGDPPPRLDYLGDGTPRLRCTIVGDDPSTDSGAALEILVTGALAETAIVSIHSGLRLSVYGPIEAGTLMAVDIAVSLAGQVVPAVTSHEIAPDHSIAPTLI